MSPGEFLSDRLGGLLLHLIVMAATGVFLLASGTESGVLVIVFLAWALVLLTVHVWDYLRLRAYLRELNAIMDGLDRKYLFAECVPKPRGIFQRRSFDLMRRSGKAMIEAVSDAQASQRDYREYIESWVHEIKTPITAAQLICRQTDPDIRRRLSRELAAIDDHVERALFYARAESPEKDFIIRQISLDDIVSQALDRHRALLIQSGVHIETKDLCQTVYTDDKWVSFMVGQLLQNAVRYRRGQDPAITLSARPLGRQVQLTVCDNGIGIPPRDLSRVFERGFTGANGRSRGGSTGMGLYLCRRLAGFLAVDLQIRSREGRSTSVTLTFPAKEDLSKM